MTAFRCSESASPRGRPEAETSHGGLMCQLKGSGITFVGNLRRVLRHWFQSGLHFGQLSEHSLERGGGTEAIRRLGWGPEDISIWQTWRQNQSGFG